MKRYRKKGLEKYFNELKISVTNQVIYIYTYIYNFLINVFSNQPGLSSQAISSRFVRLWHPRLPPTHRSRALVTVRVRLLSSSELAHACFFLSESLLIFNIFHFFDLVYTFEVNLCFVNSTCLSFAASFTQ